VTPESDNQFTVQALGSGTQVLVSAHDQHTVGGSDNAAFYFFVF
jgi:hypothetical protein